MIDRYSTKKMKDIWNDENKFLSYLKVELASLKAFVNEGIIPEKDYLKIKENAKIDLKRLYEIEEETKHDVIAFTRMISESLGEERKWFHYGLTSTDVVDTAYSIQLKEANKIIKEDLNSLLESIRKKAMYYKDLPTIGRTHGVHAEITSFGLKWALYYDELKRHIERFELSSKDVESGKMSGAVGNYTIIKPEIQDYVCKELGITSSKISTQVLTRDLHANYIFVISLIGTLLEKIALEIRHLQRTEVREVQEGFGKGQKGSSAMPHKKNPIASENITGISRVLRGYVVPALEDITLWHERDISHSSVERIIIPDATNLMDYSLNRMTRVIDNLVVNEDRIINNIWLTNGLVFSQRVLTELINKGMSREKAYDLVQKISMETWETNKQFKDLLKENKEVILSVEELEQCFDLKFYLKEVDTIYKRVFDE